MLRLPAFRLLEPRTIDDAIALLAEEGAGEASPRSSRVRVVAGGTDLWPNLKRGHETAAIVVSLGRIGGLDEIRFDGAGDLRLGAMTRLTSIAAHPAVRDRYPSLCQAIGSISSPLLRNMGTLGGNVCLDTRCNYYNQSEEWRRAIGYCMKAAGETCWVAPGSPRCWAVSASDSAPMLGALGARVRLISRARGERAIPIEDLYRDDGIAYLAISADELLTEVVVPAAADAAHCASAFEKVRRRGSIDFAVLSAAVALWRTARGEVEKARVFLGAVSSRPVAAERTQELLVLGGLGSVNLDLSAAAARQNATPMDNTDLQAQWRGHVLQHAVRRALDAAVAQRPR
jgi:4-hydroxybenzoyl-CoA reductase subunit beta